LQIRRKRGPEHKTVFLTAENSDFIMNEIYDSYEKIYKKARKPWLSLRCLSSKNQEVKKAKRQCSAEQ